MVKHADRITTLDMDAKQQRAGEVATSARRRTESSRFDSSSTMPGICLGPDASFDAVVTVNTFHHLARPMRVFKEMLRVLKPSGKLVLSDFSPRGFQIFNKIHQFEGGTHPRLKNGLAGFARQLVPSRLENQTVQRVQSRNPCGDRTIQLQRKRKNTHDYHRNSHIRRPSSRTLWRLPRVYVCAGRPRAERKFLTPGR